MESCVQDVPLLNTKYTLHSTVYIHTGASMLSTTLVMLVVVVVVVLMVVVWVLVMVVWRGVCRMYHF